MRPLRADELELRVGTVGKKGATMLLYKNARVDMAVLDETFGPENWQRDHKEIKGNIYCGIGVWDKDKKEWVWKWDCGTESYTEKEKGEASDSFKRAGFCWGIGRELYTAPFIFFMTGTEEIGNGKYKLANPREFYGVYVSDIRTEEKDGKLVITALRIKQKNNTKGEDTTIWEWRAE